MITPLLSIPGHLVEYLKNLDSNENLYVGHNALQNKGNDYPFNSGAAGYILSKVSLGGLVGALKQKKEYCNVDGGNSWLNGNPGLLTAECLAKTVGATAPNTLEKDGHVFHTYGIVRMVKGNVDDWFVNAHKSLPWIQEDEKVPLNFDCCSRKTISFHYVYHKEHKVLYEILSNEKFSSIETKNFDERLNALMNYVPRFMAK